jgi:hypothetical protein
LRLHGPTERKFRSDDLRFLELQEIEKPFKGRGWFLEFCSEGAPKCYILPQRTAQGFHRAPPWAGHGWATSRNASKATWV